MAEGGNRELEYSLEGDLPEGLEFDAVTRTISGTPEVSQAPTEYTWTATDADGDAVEIRFFVFGSVLEDLVPNFAEGIADQIYVEGSPIEPLSLPVATGGTGELDYTLEGELLEGLEFDAVTRTISGIPAGPHAPAEYTWTATDANGDAADLVFSLMVEEDVNPEFTEEVQNQTWIQDSEIAVLDLPGAEGGNGPYAYSISPELPTGLTFWAGDQTILGTPTVAQERTIYVYRAVDADGDAVELTFSPAVLEDLMPSFAEGVGGQIWTEDSAVETLVLPEGSGGNGELTYELFPELARGLAFDPETRTISGTPVVPKERTRYSYRAIDADGDVAQLTFSVMVLKDLMPSFGEAVQNQTWIQDSEIAALDLPGADGGNGAISYSITPELPAGLVFQAGDQTVLGTPTEAQERTLYVFRAVDADADAVELTFSLAVLEDLMPSFAESVEAQTWTEDSLVEPLELPAAEGGNGPLSYSLSPELPAEMAFNAETRTISGRPTDPHAETEYTLTATDADSDPVGLVFSVTVIEDLMPSFSETVSNQTWTQDSAVDLVVPEASGGNGALRYTMTPELPEGVTFDEGTRTISGTPSTPQDLTRYVYRAIDEDGDVAGFAIWLKVLEDLMPEFPASAEDQVWTQDSPVTLELPAAEGGNGALVYTLSPELPDGLMFEGPRQRIRGTPTTPQAETEYTLTATDEDGDPVDLTFSLRVIEDLMPSFAEGVRDQTWTQDSEIEPIVLPEASGGNGALRYTLLPELPAGVSLDEGSRTISGTPTAPQDLTRYVYRAIDEDGDVVGFAFSVKVLEDLMPGFSASVEDQVWTQDSLIGTLELPVAEGGNGALAYTLSPELPDGLTFEGPRQRIRGTPTVPMDQTTFTLTATDEDGDAVELTFSLTVIEDLMPGFAEGVRNQTWTQDSEIEPIVLPEASGGNGALRYTLLPELPAGVSLDEGSRTISGTPTTPHERTRYVYRAIDEDGDVVGFAFSVKVLEDLMPGFSASVEDQVWTQDSSIGTLELPVAEGGNGALAYTLSPELPDGLTFQGPRQRIRGTPTVPMDQTTFTYTATDEDGDAVELTFALTVIEDLMPGFAEGVRDQTWTQNSEIEPIVLPEASGGNGELRYTLAPELPAGVSLDEGSRTISGTPTTPHERTRYVYRAIDEDGDVAGVAFSLAVAEDLTPEFTESVEDRNYITDVAIAAWVLPKATSGNGALVYTLTPDLPVGLSFDPPSRKITGTPTVAQERTEYTYTATDADGDTGSLTFGLTITLAKPTALNLLPSLELLAGGNAVSVSVDGLFSGRELAYLFESSDSEVATVQSGGASAEVTPKREGSATVTVTATNSSGSADIQFSVTVSTAPEERAVLNDVLAGLARARLSSLTGVIGRRFEAGAASSLSASQASGYEVRGRALWFDDVDAALGGPGNSRRGSSSRLWGRTFAVALGSGESGNSSERAGAMSDQSMSEPSSKMRWSLWGAGDQQTFSGGESNSYEGDLRSVYLGLDGEFGKSWLGGSRWLTGVSVASSSGEAEYDFTDSDMSGSGTFTTSLTSVYPYMRGALASGLELWSIVGVGSGEVTNERAHLEGTTDEGDLTMGLLALGMRKPLTGAQTRLTLLGDAAQEWLSANGTGSLSYNPVSSVQRARMGVELARRIGGGLEPFGELSGRYDGGDGDAGSGVEVAAGSRYRSARLDIEARGRMLAMHSASGYKETGFGARIRVRSHADGTGMSMSMSPRWGRAEGSGALWRDQALQLRSGGAAGASRLRAPTLGGGIGYGLAAARGVVTPALEMDRNDYGRTRLRLALGYIPAPALMRALDMHGAMLDLGISRAEGLGSDPEHEIRMRGRLRL